MGDCANYWGIISCIEGARSFTAASFAFSVATRASSFVSISKDSSVAFAASVVSC